MPLVAPAQAAAEMNLVARYTAPIVLLVVFGLSRASADPVLVRGAGGGVLEVDRVEDLVALIGRGYKTLPPAETEAWKKRRRDQELADANIERNAENRSIVYVTGVAIVLFVIATLVLVYWIRRRLRVTGR